MARSHQASERASVHDRAPARATMPARRRRRRRQDPSPAPGEGRLGVVECGHLGPDGGRRCGRSSVAVSPATAAAWRTTWASSRTLPGSGSRASAPRKPSLAAAGGVPQRSACRATRVRRAVECRRAAHAPGDVQGQPVEAMEQVGAKRAAGDHVAESRCVAATTRTSTATSRSSPTPSTRPPAGPEGPWPAADLHLADFVQEQHAAVGGAEQAAALALAPVYAPRRWPKNSLSAKAGLIAPQLTTTRGRPAACDRADGAPARTVLARAGLAGDEDVQIAQRCHPRRPVVEPVHRLTHAHDAQLPEDLPGVGSRPCRAGVVGDKGVHLRHSSPRKSRSLLSSTRVAPAMSAWQRPPMGQVAKPPAVSDHPHPARHQSRMAARASARAAPSPRWTSATRGAALLGAPHRAQGSPPRRSRRPRRWSR